MNSAVPSASQGRFRRFADFYPFYLSTFTHPWYSLAADFVLFRDMLTGRVRF
jgi:hypothetical protein